MLSGVWCSKGRVGDSEKREGKVPRTVPRMHGVLAWVSREVTVESENLNWGEEGSSMGRGPWWLGAVYNIFLGCNNC